MMSTNIIIGFLLILGGLGELASIIFEYSSGKLSSWPIGSEATLLLIIIAGIYFLKNGMKKKL